jgi:hypothetical protein
MQKEAEVPGHQYLAPRGDGKTVHPLLTGTPSSQSMRWRQLGRSSGTRCDYSVT